MNRLDELRRRRAATEQGGGVERKEQQHEAPASSTCTKLAALRMAIDEGDASGIAEGNVFARVRQTLALPRTSR